MAVAGILINDGHIGDRAFLLFLPKALQ